ncbi:MAG TPA: glycosyltransferase family 39 protein, partial [Anaerolineae bacterium]|nr:glycosyltransferase family 39 protein [Anaerolineae bacterium]
MKYRFGAILLLVIMLWLEVSTLSITAATPDEPMHILRGYVFVQRGLDRIGSCVPCSPVLSGALIGAGLSLEPNLQLPPADDPGWHDKTAFGFQEQFLWEKTAPPLRLIFLARLPIIAISLLLGALIFRWASRRSGPLPALGALTLYVFCPNFLAHARLATTDVVAAATFALSVYTFARALDSTRRITWIVSGIALGLALAAKVSAVWLPVTFAILVAGRLWQARHDRRSWLPPIGLLISTGLIGGLTLWGIYRFTIGPIAPGGFPVPAPGFWGEWQAFNDYLKDPLPGYLLGQVTQFGWWYYFPVAFAAKTPLPILIFLLFAVGYTLRTRSWSRDLALLIAPGLLFASLLFSPHALGYRYLLPILPFILVYSAEVIKHALKIRWQQIASVILIAWQVIGTLRYHPYYLTYFNEIVGGPDRGRYILIDSNLDWGQDLPALKQYVDEHQIDQLKFSYAGASPATVYGLTTEALPPVYPAMRDQGAWWLHTFYPADPAPGWYAISVNPLMSEPANYAFFRDRTPAAIVGNSI